MKIVFVMLMGALPLLAQQLTMPEDFNADQRKLFLKIASSVSAPCCNNGIPVAYHESGMAIYVQEVIRDSIKAGKSEKQIMSDLKDMRLGDQGLRLIFTVPENDGLGWATWASPAVVILLGVLGVFYFLSHQRRTHKGISNDELLEQYREAILAQAKTLHDA